MSKLTKEDVILKLTSALSVKEGRKVHIEQKGGWFKIDGGKSLRFSQLESLLENETKASKSVTTEPVEKISKKMAAPIVTITVNPKGKKPKDLWREKLLADSNKLPRGFKIH